MHFIDKFMELNVNLGLYACCKLRNDDNEKIFPHSMRQQK